MDIESLGVNPDHVALARAVSEIELEVAQLGWDRPSTVYALVPSSTILADPAGLPAAIRQDLEAQVQAFPNHLTAILQEELPGQRIEESLGYLSWPEQVVGMAVSMERVSVPPEAEKDAPSDPDAAISYYATHPDRQEFRIVAGVLRDGQSWSAIRSRDLDDPDKVAQASDLVPDLTAALLATFTDEEE
ncbi:PPA1309 family protein [Boudabousia marimammalium]|uniref:Uncharacterized protein n=1 Tax=Boudabousia marimammalium TaxID=156892 RepID=A0A1Q5PLY7_9ACTO|nr:PPA1309 family protein [Boudabousia marimammalium]OKL48063.1 hypothetical protein BM477_06245 [Boudabousia marimammalium]